MRRTRLVIIILVALTSGALALPKGKASIWTGAAGNGRWDFNSNWNPISIPDRQDAVADFSALNIASDSSVFLHGNRTIGTLVFGDIEPSHNWIIEPGTPDNSILTLDVFTGEPIVNVVNQSAILRVPLAGNDGWIKTGLGRFVLTRANSHTGRTTVRSGTLALDFADSGLITSNILPSTSELLLGGLGVFGAGGTLELTGSNGASVGQALGGTTLHFGANNILVNQHGAANIDLFLGLFDRDVGSVLKLDLPTAGNIRAQNVTIPNVNGILGAWATIGSGAAASWAANDGTGNIVPYSAFSDVTGAPMIANGPATNVRWSASTGAATLAAGTTDINTLLFQDAARRTLAIPAGATLRTGVSGGIFKTDTSADETVSQLTVGTSGTFLTAGGAPNVVGELILNANSSQPNQDGIVINSTITNNGLAPVSVIKSGNASVLFSATNTYTDGTYITSGRLRTSATGGLGTGPVYLATGAQAYLEAGTHANDFFVSGKGLIEPFDGRSSGALRLGNNSADAAGRITLLGDAQITVAGTGSAGATISGQITGPFALDFGNTGAGSGIVTLTNRSNSWSGNTTIGPGVVLRVGGTGEVLSDANVTMQGDLEKTALSVLDLNGRIESIGSLSSAGNAQNVLVTSSTAGNATLRIGGTGTQRNFGGVITDGAGTVGLTKFRSGTQVLSGTNSYTGPTRIEEGTIRLGSARSLPDGASLTIERGALDMAGFNVTLSNLSSPIGGVSGIGNSATTTPVVLTVAGGTSTFAGVLFNNLALTIDGGFLTLRGIGENSGPTTVNSGILSVTGSLPTTGSVIVNSGATLSGAMVGGAGGIGRVGNVTMEPGANVRAGATAADGSVGTLTMSTLTVNGGDMRFDLAGGGASDRITVVGTATFNAPSTITPSLVVPGTHTLLTADTLRGVAPRLNLPTGARATFALNFETLADQIRLIITGSPPKTLTWNGANGSEWDLNTTANWTDGAMAETFFNLDSVIFPDAAAIRNIVVNATVVPGSVLVNSSPGNDYTIAGSGSIGDSSFTGTTLMKRGGGTLTLGGTTAYHATMTIEEGLLRTTGSIVINNPVTIASSARLIIEGIASLAEIIGTGSTEVGNTTTAATLAASHVRQASLTIAAGSEVRTKPIGGTTVLGALNIAGPADAPTARFDLNNNAAVVNYAGTSPISTIRSQMLAGRGGAGLGKPWTGMGITSSAAAAAVAAEPESSSVGFAENATLPLGPYTTFRGQPVDDTSIVMAFTRTGDANLDGLVNDDDVTIVGATYAPGVPQAAWALGDFDYNGFVDDDDVTLLGVFYDPSAPPLAVSPPGSIDVIAVPEPSAFLLMAIVALTLAFLLNRKRA